MYTRKIYHLASCSTCQRIIKDMNNGEGFEMQDIKSEPLNENQLDWMKDLVGSYESLFSRRTMKYRGKGLHEKQLMETDYRDLILIEYTFLKRPVIVIDDKIFVGNSKRIVEAAIEALKKSRNNICRS